jgi:hypothetical protein
VSSNHDGSVKAMTSVAHARILRSRSSRVRCHDVGGTLGRWLGALGGSLGGCRWLTTL